MTNIKNLDSNHSKMHFLDIYPEVADDLYLDRRSFDIRPIFEGIQVGDHIKYTCVERGIRLTKYHEIHNNEYEVIYVCHDIGLERNWCAIGIKLVD